MEEKSNAKKKLKQQKFIKHLKRSKVNNKLRMNNTNKSNHPFRFHKNLLYKNMNYTHVNETIVTLRNTMCDRYIFKCC